MDWCCVCLYLEIIVMFVVVFDYVGLGVFSLQILLYVFKDFNWYVRMVNDVMWLIDQFGFGKVVDVDEILINVGNLVFGIGFGND